MAEKPPYLLYYQSLRDLDRAGAIAVAERYLVGGGNVEGLYDEVMKCALEHTGREWQQGRISVAHEHYISAVTRDLVRHYGPRLWADIPAIGPVAALCGVPGERHSIGLLMVSDVLRAGGLAVYVSDDGLPAESLLDFVVEVGADLVCFSCALDIHLSDLADLIPRVRQARPGVRVAVGGGAIQARVGTPGLRLGADYAANDACDVRRLLQGWIADLGRTTPARPAAPVP